MRTKLFCLTAWFSLAYASGAAVAQTQTAGDAAAPEAASAGSLLSDPCSDDGGALTGDWNGVRARLAKDQGVTFCLQEQSEGWANLAGGVRRGAVYTGLTTASVKATDPFGLDGVTFMLSMFQMHGRGATANLTGNLQTIGNTEATRGFKLYNLWIEKALLGGDLTIRVGQEGANDEFMLAKSAASFINSSFGFPASMALSLPSGGPNYPLATPMVRVQYKVSPQFTAMAAVFNGDPAGPGTNDPQIRDRTGTAFRMRDGTFSIAELGYSVGTEGAEGRPGVYKLGGWQHSGRFNDLRYDTVGRALASPASNGIARAYRGDWGAYAVFDQTIWRPVGDGDRGLNVFGLVSVGPDDRNLSNLFLQGGIAWTGPTEARSKDVAGLAFAYTGLSSAQRGLGSDLVRFGSATSAYAAHETIVELSYRYWVMPGLTLQPDLQYVFNPGAGIPNAASNGVALPLRNVFIAGLRATLTF